MKTSTIFSLLTLTGSSFVAAVPAGHGHGGPPPAPKAYIRNGTVHGRHSPEWDQDFFLGIPYARPPTGPRRFRPPQHHTHPLGDIQAQETGNWCWGYRGDQWEYPQHEDCLTLNIVRPAGINYNHRKLPVAIFIHGGGFLIGSAHDQRYNMTFLVDQSVKEGTPIIGIGINYRLGGLGWIASRQVAGTKNLNLGLKDQRVALHWVQENIRAFGGDPRKVTLFGASAGALSIGLHQLAYNGRDDKLFSQVMLLSGAPTFFATPGFPETGQARYDYILAQTGCTNHVDSLECLRGVPISTLNAAINSTGGQYIAPTVDGEFVSGLPSENLKHGRFVKVPTVMAGTTDEGAGYARQLVKYETEAQLRGWLEATTLFKPSMLTTLLNHYDDSTSIPAASDFSPARPNDPGSIAHGDQYHRMAAILGDLWFISGKRNYAQKLAHFGVPVWSVRSNVLPNGYAAWSGAVHTTDVNFIFNNLHSPGYDIGGTGVRVVQDPMGGPRATQFKDLADFASRSFVRFFARGDPAAGRKPGDVNWIKYKQGGPLKANQIVWDVDDNGIKVHIEQDTFRESGIQHITDHYLQGSF
ncbi:hypothetical protein AOL_s00097g440 [Orbilia oligospora ATCC 24927]|uniref:Carboxylic ester hydrolase n=2 Tax=Orbilia oligospora TaxID=2813651 RepID=G1XJB3_ARTOA|nr:hypothetical protein AOL_s00097g440 [Orbilia oligospora ATCC 24927]EGX46692.1 hypothetical protein AOL_s00097g440 [Orbilia oligospora ATCC 24927]KAF3274845.1 hypothetical protein TWF970_007557 [Orbilia oligospora]